MGTSPSAPTSTSLRRWAARQKWQKIQQPPPRQVGRGVAHDEYIEFSIEGNTILYQVLQLTRKYFNASMTFYIFCSRSNDNLLITPGWREWDQCRQNQGGVHQELQGQPKDQCHRPDQGEEAKAFTFTLFKVSTLSKESTLFKESFFNCSRCK